MSRHSLSPAFQRLLAAQAASRLGAGLHLAALPLLITSLTTDPRVVAALALTASLPGLVLALPVGVWVDRGRPLRLMIVGNLLCAVVLGILVITAAITHLQPWLLFVVAGTVAVGELVVGTSAFAFLPGAVAPDDLTRANSLLGVADQTGTGVVGPALGGIAYAANTLAPFVINAVSYVISAGAIGSILRVRRDDVGPEPTTSRHVGPTESGPTSTDRHAWWAGATFVAHHRALRALVLLSASLGLFGWMPEATLVLFARETLRVQPTGFGILLGVTTIGAIVGGVATARLGRRLHALRLFLASYLAYGLLLIPVGLTTDVRVVSVLFFLQGLPLIACDAAVRSLQQTLTPPELLGRVGALGRAVHGVVTPLGLAAGGLLSGWFGYSAVWIIAGVGFTVLLGLGAPALIRRGS